MYNEKLEALITAALADGVLTEKEKQILFKKAEAMGIDLDEFEMVLDARLVELKKKEAKANQQYQLEMEKAKSAQPSAPKSEKYGDVRKCPACGAIVPSMAAKCPECGYEFTNVEANSSTRLLMQKIDEIQAQYAELTANVDNKDESAIRTRGYQVKRQLNDRTAQLIQNFPIPNTREDLIEFLTLCIGNSKADSIMLDGNDPVTPAWRKKLQQVIAKVKVALPNDQQAQELIDEYEGKRENSKKKGKKIAIGIVVLFVIALLIAFLVPKEMSPKEQVKALSEQVVEMVNKGDLDGAKTSLNNVTVPEEFQKEGTAYITEQYDAMYLSLINAYIKKGDLDAAEEVGSIFRSKINNDMSWQDASCYKTLKKVFKENNRDFSALKSEYDYRD
jgi:cell fate (sporulation/competence/biofilm development) regulator YlbF (YheA/YmcA/DUF963 family)